MTERDVKRGQQGISPGDRTSRKRRKPAPLQAPAFDTYTAVGLAEGFIEPESDEQVIAAWQYLIDTGLCWTLQGFFGRTAASLIEQGICQPARRV